MLLLKYRHEASAGPRKTHAAFHDQTFLRQQDQCRTLRASMLEGRHCLCLQPFTQHQSTSAVNGIGVPMPRGHSGISIFLRGLIFYACMPSQDAQDIKAARRAQLPPLQSVTELTSASAPPQRGEAPVTAQAATSSAGLDSL